MTLFFQESWLFAVWEISMPQFLEIQLMKCNIQSTLVSHLQMVSCYMKGYKEGIGHFSAGCSSQSHAGEKKAELC